MKKSILHTFLLGLVVILASCGGSGSSSTSSSHDSTSSNSRQIKMDLKGDLSNVGGVTAVRASDGARFRFSLTSASRANGLVVNSTTGVVNVPVSNFDPAVNNFSIQITDATDAVIGELLFTADPANPGSYTTSFNVIDPVTGTGSGAPINLGTVTVPTGAGATSVPVQVIPTTNVVTNGTATGVSAPAATGGATGGNTTGGPTGSGGDDDGVDDIDNDNDTEGPDDVDEPEDGDSPDDSSDDGENDGNDDHSDDDEND
ncbi:hypothetical protein MNBD_NITROSPINAE02-109 [hydrothermal vent metagenome]|uniref:Uncharacterized protein n=1 Tax=hydrothermal vent metagenome TaxID=652676 RepID=A0A3B1CYB0_9ZZZZ